MAFLDDLAKSVGIFQQGMQQLSTTRAFSRANDELSEINQQALNEQEQRAATQQVSNQLGQELLQAGQPIARIQQALQSFGPAPLAGPGELITEGVTFDDPEQVQRGQDILRAQLEPAADIAERKATRVAEAAAAKQLAADEKALSKEGRKSVLDSLNRFRTANKADFDAIGKADSTIALLNSSKDPSVVNLATITLLKLAGESGRLSDEDFKRAMPGAGSLTVATFRSIKSNILVESLTRDREILKDIIGKLKIEAIAGLKKKAEGFAEQREGLIPGSTKNVFTQRLLRGIEATSRGETVPAASTTKQTAPQGTALKDIPGFSL